MAVWRVEARHGERDALARRFELPIPVQIPVVGKSAAFRVLTLCFKRDAATFDRRIRSPGIDRREAVECEPDDDWIVIRCAVRIRGV